LRTAKVMAGIAMAISALFAIDIIQLITICFFLIVFAMAQKSMEPSNTNTYTHIVSSKDSEVMSKKPRMLKGLGLRAALPFTQMFGQANKDKVVVIIATICIMLLFSSFTQKKIEAAFVLLVFFVFALRLAKLKSTPALAAKTFLDDRVPVVQSRNGCTQGSNQVPAIEAHTNTVKTKCKKKDVQHVKQGKHRSRGWEAEIQELISQHGMTPQCEKVLQSIIDAVKKALSPLIPHIEVSGYSAGNPMLNNAFSHAMPRIKVVAKATSEQILKIAEARHKSPLPTEGREVDEYAIRVFTRQLVSEAGFMFGRTAFSMDEVWTVLRVPLTLGLCPETVTIALSVNSDTPLHSATLLTECSKLDPRVAPLCLLVRRWTRNRGIQFANQGHLQAYAWDLITVFFLQVSGESILPPMAEGFSSKTVGEIKGQNSSKSVAELFRDLIAFYARDFDWQREGICVRLGVRGKRTDTPLLEEPLIEEPFSVKRNLGITLNAAGAKRLREELQRADQYCSRGASLKELIHLWDPPVESSKTSS